MTYTQTARMCAVLSDLVYETPTREDLTPLGLTWAKHYEHDGAQAMVCGAGRKVFVVFRGTDEKADIFSDVRFIKTDFPGGGRVHRGFFEHFLKISKAIRDDLKLLDPTIPRIYTGHSLGGACVQLLAALEPPDEAHVFGCPYVGNSGFISRIQGYGVLYEARWDPVTWIPFRYFIPVQALYALWKRRLPTMYIKPPAWIRWGVDSDLHSMEGYREALEGANQR